MQRPASPNLGINARLGASQQHATRANVTCLPLQNVTQAVAASVGLPLQSGLQAHRSHRPQAVQGRDPAFAPLHLGGYHASGPGAQTPCSTQRDVNPPSTRRSLVSMASQWEHYKPPPSQRAMPGPTMPPQSQRIMSGPPESQRAMAGPPQSHRATSGPAMSPSPSQRAMAGSAMAPPPSQRAMAGTAMAPPPSQRAMAGSAMAPPSSQRAHLYRAACRPDLYTA